MTFPILIKVSDLEHQLKSVKEEKAELEVSSDRAGFLEAQVRLPFYFFVM